MKEIQSALQNGEEVFLGSRRVTFGQVDPVQYATFMRMRMLLHPEVSPESVAANGYVHDSGDSYMPITQESGLLTYVGVKTLAKKGTKISENPDSLEAVVKGRKPIIIGGACLFGGNVAAGIQKDGQIVSLIHPQADVPSPIIDISINSRMHVNEVDHLTRVIPFLRHIAEQTRAAIMMHIPLEEYYLYGISLYQEQKMTFEALQKWFNAVDKRYEGMNRLTRRRLPEMNTLHPLHAIRNIVRENPSITLDEVLALLQIDETWKMILSRKKPISFSELGYLSYVYAYVHFAQKDTLVLGVEDVTEERMYFQIKRVLPADQDPAILIQYLHPHFAVEEGEVLPDAPRKIYYYNGESLYSLLKWVLTRNRRGQI